MLRKRHPVTPDARAPQGPAAGGGLQRWDNGSYRIGKEFTVAATSAFSGLTALGWDHRWISALADLGDPALWPARVSRVDRGACTAMTGSAVVRIGTERDLEVAVGDWVGVAGSAANRTARIAAVLPRRAVFRRTRPSKGADAKVVAANIDTVFVCDALDGNLSLRHLERFLTLVWQSGATPVVVITKSDAVPLQNVTDAVSAARTVAGEVSLVVVNSRSDGGVLALEAYLMPGRTVALLGLSGAGKSTLANRLAGAEILATGAVRGDGSGRHTTTHRELVPRPGRLAL